MNVLAITMYLLHGTVTYCGVPVEGAPPVVACQRLCIVEDREAFLAYGHRVGVQAGTIVEWADTQRNGERIMPTIGEVIAIVAMALVLLVLSMTDTDFDPDVSEDARRETWK